MPARRTGAGEPGMRGMVWVLVIITEKQYNTLHARATTDIVLEMTNPLDTSISDLADLAGHMNATDAAARDLIAVWAFADAGWLANFTMGAMASGLSIGQALASMLPRVATGYQPGGVRRDVRALSYRDGLAVAPKRATADDRAKAEAVKLYGPRPVLACEVAA